MEDPKQGTPLNPRERQTVELLLEGLTNKDIAYRMGIAHSTVKVYVRNAMKRSGTTNRVKAMLHYQREWAK